MERNKIIDNLEDFTAEEARRYWKEFSHWRQGKTPDKPEITPGVRAYWEAQKKAKMRVKLQQNREFHTYENRLRDLEDPDAQLDWWNAKDAAEYLGMSTAMIYKYLQLGVLEGVQITGKYGHWIITPDAIRELEVKVKTLERDMRKFYLRIVYHALLEGKAGK